jgi:acetyltransferase-like isoleucine patch superfamily enzyme
MPRLVATILFALPTRLASPLVGLLGARIHPTARVGFSWIQASQLALGPGARIGHLNVVRVRRLVLKQDAAFGSMNWLAGRYSAVLAANAEIGARNVITRAAVATEIGPSRLLVGTWSKITASHRFDLMRSVRIGDHSVVAGVGSQFWTHGYVHVAADRSRYRVDGGIDIGDDCYIGSACVFNPGIVVGDGIAVGSNAAVSKDLDEPGLYVSQALRHIKRADGDVRAALVPATGNNLTEVVYTKPVRKHWSGND